MDALEHLQIYLNQAVPQLTDSDWDLVIPHWKVTTVKRGEHVLNAGEYCKNLYFIHHGILREYKVIDGSERTMHFLGQSDFFTEFESLYSQRCCHINVQALEESVVAVLPYHRLQEAYLSSHMVERVGRLMVERAFMNFIDQTNRFANASPEARLEELETKQPEIARKVSQKILATYLGIQPESLSRIRKRRVKPETN